MPLSRMTIQRNQRILLLKHLLPNPLNDTLKLFSKVKTPYFLKSHLYLTFFIRQLGFRMLYSVYVVDNFLCYITKLGIELLNL